MAKVVKIFLIHKSFFSKKLLKLTKHFLENYMSVAHANIYT